MATKVDATSGNLVKKIFIYAIPLILTSILQEFFNIADKAVLGNMAGSIAVAAIGTTGNWFNGSSETKVVTEDGKTYASYIHGAATGGCITFYKENSKVAQGEEFNSGKYIVMKFRVRNGIGGLILQNATGEGSAVKGVKHTFTQSENGWQVAVIDLSQFQNYTTDTTTSWAALGLTTGASANTNATLDVEYFAIVSSLDNVASIIDEDTYDYYADWTQAPVEKSVNAQ